MRFLVQVLVQPAQGRYNIDIKIDSKKWRAYWGGTTGTTGTGFFRNSPAAYMRVLKKEAVCIRLPISKNGCTSCTGCTKPSFIWV